MYSVYILRCADGTYYTGIALCPVARLAAHNSGRGARYTRGRLPAALVYTEKALTKGAALRREMAIKKLSRAQKLALIREASIFSKV